MCSQPKPLQNGIIKSLPLNLNEVFENIFYFSYAKVLNMGCSKKNTFSLGF